MSIGNSPSNDPPSVPDDAHHTPSDGPSIGRILQQARTAAGLTIEEVSARTRVRTPILHAMERDDFTRCGGDVYARGHLRTVARAIDIDPTELIQRYDAEHGGRSAPTAAAALFEAERIRPEPRRPNWTAAMVAAIVAVIGFVGFTVFRGEETGGSQPIAGGSASPTRSAHPSPSHGKSSDPKPDPSDSAIAAVPADKVTVKLTAVDGSSWISAKDHNGRLLDEGVLKQGSSKTFTDTKRIDLVLGNAGAIQLYVNGKQIDDRGEKGQVQRLSYTRGDPEAG